MSLLSWRVYAILAVSLNVVPFPGELSTDRRPEIRSALRVIDLSPRPSELESETNPTPSSVTVSVSVPFSDSRNS